MTKENKKVNKNPSEVDGKFQLLLTLITLLKNARHKDKKTELEFLMVNQTFNLTPYRNCAYWECKKEKITIKNISGLVQIDPDGPYTQWLVRVINNVVQKQTKNSKKDENGNSFSRLITVTADDCDVIDRDDWDNWTAKNVLLILMQDNSDSIWGGLWLDREQPFSTLERAVLEDLGDGYAHALKHFETKKNQRAASSWLSLFKFSGSKVRLFFIALFIISMIPVRISATAPAEVVANKPDTINVPFDGVIDVVEVSPGQQVQAGDILIRMDSTLLKNKVVMTTGELNAAQIALLKTERESLKDRSKLADIAILKAQLEQKSAEVSFAQDMLQRAEIIADRDGIVIFSDPSALRGKPVQTGEQIMLLADPADSELLIRMPVSSMIKINKDVPARFFLNVTPLSSKKINYDSIGYQATMDTGGLMTYKIRGKFIDKENDIRIGWTGTGKIYGERTILALNILRRPLTTLRRKLGI